MPFIGIITDENKENCIRRNLLEQLNLKESSVLFIKEKSIGRIFLNFSTPYPKKSHAKHRLTSPDFLSVYKKLLSDGGVIEQKTDSKILFESSLENLSQNGFILQNISLDLHNSDFEGNIVTEYESKFVEQGLPIYRLEAKLK